MKIYRTIIAYEILSSEPYDGGDNLEYIANKTTHGEWSGQMLSPIILNQELIDSDAVSVIKKQGNDPKFFNFYD